MLNVLYNKIVVAMLHKTTTFIASELHNRLPNTARAKTKTKVIVEEYLVLITHDALCLHDAY
jgi:hypothetical protein